MTKSLPRQKKESRIIVETCYQFSQLILNNGKETALVYVCGAILLTFFFKNLFSYLSLFFMAPVRNGIVRDVRRQLFDKILVLPLAYFPFAGGSFTPENLP